MISSFKKSASQVEYVADASGFHVEASNLPIAVPLKECLAGGVCGRCQWIPCRGL